MPIRSLFASLIIAGLIVGGAMFIMARQQVNFDDFVLLLQMRAPGATIFCWMFAWGATAAAALSVLTGFAAFLDDPDEDDYRRRGFPKGLPAALLIIALVLFWAAFTCVGRRGEERVVIPIDASAGAGATAAVVQPVDEAGADVEDALAGASTDEGRIESPAEAEAEPAPVDLSRDNEARTPAGSAIMAQETALVWEYKYPLILGESYVYSPRMSEAIAALFPAGDPNGDVRAMLCGKAWVAFTGSASEEGPRERNVKRAQRRAEMVAGAASDWLDAHEDCQRPVILAITLGQHAATTIPLADGGRSTGYQRQALVASRDRAAGEAVSRASASKELAAYLDSKDGLDALLGGRRYVSAPAIFTP